MNVQVLFICGAIAGVLSVFAYLPYIVDTVKRRTKPQRSTWMIWSILSSMSFLSMLSEGATDALWFAGVQAGGTIIVSLLSIRFGTGNFLSRADSFVLIGAAFGFYLWYVTDSAVYALAISIGISTLGGVLTVTKSYRDPDSESLLAWLVSFVATVFAMASVGKLDFVILAYPFYLFALYGSIIIAMLLGRMAKTLNGRSQSEYSAPQLQEPVVFRTLVQSGRGLGADLEKLNDEKLMALVLSLKKRGVRDRVLNDALNDVVHG